MPPVRIRAPSTNRRAAAPRMNRTHGLIQSATTTHAHLLGLARHPPQRSPNYFGFTTTPHGRRPTGTDFSAFSVATSITVRSLVRPFAE